MKPGDTFRHPLENGGIITLVAEKATRACNGCIFNMPEMCYNADIGHRINEITGSCFDNKLIFKIYKNDMEKVTLEIPEGKEAKWVNNVLTLVDKEVKYGDIRDQVKSWDDVISKLEFCNKGNILKIDLKHAFDMGLDRDTMAYIKLKMIALVLNEGWTPSFDKNEKRWFPYFQVSKTGGISFVYAFSAASYALTHYGSRLAFKSKELADYAGTQFIGIYKDYLM